MSRRTPPIVGMDIRTLVRPDARDIPEQHRASYSARCQALIDVAGGLAVAVAAKTHGVDPRTVARDSETATEPASDGSLIGFRACVPYRNRRTGSCSSDDYVEAPHKKAPHAFTRLLRSYPRARDLADKYVGALPTGNRKVRSFDRLFDHFRAAVREQHGTSGYPFDVADEGRRALLNYLKRLRRERLEAGASEVESVEPNITRFSQIFHLAPMDRVEFDAHKVDVDWEVTLTANNGKTARRRFQSITVLAAICAASRYLLAYVLVLGAYNRLDVLRLFHKVLSPWRPRQLLVPNMGYVEGATLGLPVNDRGVGPRGVVIAGDNALAHHAHICVDNLLAHHRGVLNFGPAHVPEIRPIVESFFRILEQGALRDLAGGFQPKTRSDGKVRTSFVRAEDHPFHHEAFEDLLDVIASGYNCTPHSGLGGRTPASVLGTHLASDWSWYCAGAPEDAAQLTTVRFTAHIRGGFKSGKAPFVEYCGAIYRSLKLSGRPDQAGKDFPAAVNLLDLRHVILLNPYDGAPWTRLRALPPWDRTPHDQHLRQQIIRAKTRGVLSLAGSRDAIEAFHAFTREQALAGHSPPDLHARVDAVMRAVSTEAGETRNPAPTFPRGERTSFANTKD